MGTGLHVERSAARSIAENAPEGRVYEGIDNKRTAAFKAGATKQRMWN